MGLSYIVIERVCQFLIAIVIIYLRMKNSNSRDKNIKTQVPPASNPSSKLMKTDIQQPKPSQLERTNYNRPQSGKKLQSAKVLPPKGPPSKKQFVIEDHMTQSRITEAKQGLQLLKKKMSAKGLSREKIGASNEQYQAEKPVTSLKTVGSSKGEDTQYYQNRNSNVPPKKLQKKPSYQQQYKQQRPPVSTKTVPSSRNTAQSRPTPQNQRKQAPPPPAYQQYRDQQMQIPIKPKKDFNALLEQELRKQKQGQSSLPAGKPGKAAVTNKYDQYPDEGDMELIQCRHCERQFGQAAIEKHQKICLKVFQTKRKAFDSAARRAPEVEGTEQVMAPTKKQQKQTKKQPPPPPKKQQQKQKPGGIPKWKAASLAFRANLKSMKGAEVTEQEKKAADIAQGLVPCNYCGRKFNDKAAARHIAFCETKSKQMPKMNTTVTKKR